MFGGAVMALKVSLDHWWDRFDGMWQDVGAGNILGALEMLARLAPERTGRIEQARTQIQSGSVLVVLGGDMKTDEALVFEATCGPLTAPPHKHIASPFASFGERHQTLEGEIVDMSGLGTRVSTAKSGSWTEYAPGTSHQTHIKHWWVGLVYRPAGCQLV